MKIYTCLCTLRSRKPDEIIHSTSLKFIDHFPVAIIIGKHPIDNATSRSYAVQNRDNTSVVAKSEFDRLRFTTDGYLNGTTLIIFHNYSNLQNSIDKIIECE